MSNSDEIRFVSVPDSPGKEDVTRNGTVSGE